ncbi:MAG: hypothetical protein IJZ76_09350 [Lachnospiraceae bacterium]|nr:hypothetical protein [Lachnospiraceae bacterium]
MDSRKWGVKCLSKAGCYYILFGAILGAVFAVISFFVKFGEINQNSLTLLCFFLSMGLFLGFYIAISQFEDPAKMILEFHPPKATHREEIQKFCEDIYKHYNKDQKIKYVIAYPLALGIILFGIARVALNPSYFLYNLKTVFTNTFLLPALFLGFITFFIWDIIYRNRMDEIKDGAYAVAEVTLAEKYYCISGGKTSQSVRTSYFVILEDSYGNKGRFKVCESEYYRFHTGSTILLVKRTKGNLFYNAMEPVAILE